MHEDPVQAVAEPAVDPLIQLQISVEVKKYRQEAQLSMYRTPGDQDSGYTNPLRWCKTKARLFPLVAIWPEDFLRFRRHLLPLSDYSLMLG
jgi:hypothetical protein